jgi:serine/threonine-protein kinase
MMPRGQSNHAVATAVRFPYTWPPVASDPAREKESTPEPTTGVARRTPAQQSAPQVVSPIAASVFPDPMSSTAPLGTPSATPQPRPSSNSLSDLIGSGDAASLPKICSTCQSRYPLDFLVCPRDATPLTVEGQEGVDPLIGKVLGEAYQIVRLVGEGGMGRVYEARHLRLKDRRFAIKVLHPDLARDPEIVARFQREAESASSIGHPNVIDVYDVHKTHDGVPYIVGEFLEGREFGGQLEQSGHVDAPTAVHVARQVCRALSAAHKRGIVHRDMKPENVFLVEHDGVVTVKVIDFGISKVGQAGKTNLTKTGMIMGTPSYMSPEQARGDKVDHRADVYAVGAMIYHALTGKKPFDSDDPASTLSLVLTEEPERPRKLNADIPEGLELVVQRAMAKDASDRYATMADLDAALAPFDTSGSIGFGAPSVSPSGSAMPTIVSTKADATARTMMAQSSATSDAKLSRPTIVLTGLGLVMWLVAGVIDTAGGVLRHVRHDGDLTLTESVLLIIGSALIALTPVIFVVLTIRKTSWNNSVRALELAGDLRRTFFAAAVTYGVISLGVRMAFSVVLRQSSTLSSGSWDVLAFISSFVVGGLVWSSASLARGFRKRRARRV